jgi:hypothetical protein
MSSEGANTGPAAAAAGSNNASTSSSSTRRGLERSERSERNTNSGRSRDKKSSMHQRASVQSDCMDTVKREDEAKAAQTILHWSNNLVRFRVISVTKCFYRWKYYVPGVAPDESAHAPLSTVQEESDDVDLEELEEQKQSYLLLFSENEKLREQYMELRASTASKEKKLRVSAMKTCISVILRSRCTSKLRYYYDIWLNTAKSINLMAATGQRMLQLDVGLQSIESERNYVKQLEATNANLRMTLVYTAFFFKWKLNSALKLLDKERRLSVMQRQAIFAEIQRMKNVVSVANMQEVQLLNSALTRGDKLAAGAIVLKSQIDAVAASCKEEKKGEKSAAAAHTKKMES